MVNDPVVSPPSELRIPHSAFPWLAVLSVSRSRAATRAILWSVPALLLGAGVYAIYSRLHFVPTAVSNRLVDYAIAVAALPLVMLSVLSAVRAAAWLLCAVWPAKLGVFADERRLQLRLGPFGARDYDAATLDVKYPFEFSGDFEDGGFEAYLPEEEQIAKFLPRILHPKAPEPINRTILRFVRGSEADAAAVLASALALWRR